MLSYREEVSKAGKDKDQKSARSTDSRAE
jgi:hypothetical protein